MLSGVLLYHWLMGVYMWELCCHDSMLVALVTHLMSPYFLKEEQVVCVVFSESEFYCILVSPVISCRLKVQ